MHGTENPEKVVQFHSVPQHCAVAQLVVEHQIHILEVVGSSPSCATKKGSTKPTQAVKR